jgi:DNA-binding transcriptional ArsR family regulator
VNRHLDRARGAEEPVPGRRLDPQDAVGEFDRGLLGHLHVAALRRVGGPHLDRGVGPVGGDEPAAPGGDVGGGGDRGGGREVQHCSLPCSRCFRQQERQQIASGLGDRLAYAEIARRLDRPTSTVTREVMRNGGPGGYRADLAHRATERRTRRRGPVTPRESAAAPLPHGRDAAAVDDYEEAFTTVLMQSGLPKMAARVQARLYTSDSGSLTASELVQRLRVSPATVSKSIALLENLGLVRRERDERRRERYVVDADVWYQSMIASAQANTLFAETARQGVSVLGPGTPAAVRLENIARFVDFVAESIVRAAEQAREILYAKPSDPA